MFTKAIKKYMGLGLVLAFCSASSMAADYTKTLTAAQYQPLIGIYMGVYQGIAVTGTTVTGCSAPANILLPALVGDVTTGDQAPTPINLHWHAATMDILTKAKAAGRSVDVSYSSDGTTGCLLQGVTMK